MLRGFLCVCILLVGSVVQAQTTNLLMWDYDAPPTEVATYAQSVAVDGTAQSGTPTCVVNPSNPQRTACQLAIPALPAGTHTLSITASRGGMSAETRVTGVNPANAPRNPTTPRVQVTVVVTVP